MRRAQPNPTASIDSVVIDQRAVIEFLHRALPEPVEQIDTHAAVVLLAGDRAYKLKRAVSFSFLDYSTLERREHALRKELLLNHRTAPQIYLAVVPVARARDGSLSLGGAGTPVEWVLEMQRFPSGRLLSDLAARGELTDEILDGVADVIARFHTDAEQRPDMGGGEGMRRVVEENAANLRSLELPRTTGEVLGTVLRRCDEELLKNAPLLDSRRQAGSVRHCHGDLHLQNIVMLGDQPTLFDCIEFDDDYACIDVLYDLAFLVMDLVAHNLAPAARSLLQRWNDRLVDDSAMALLPLFLATRALVRAKVSAIRISEAPRGPQVPDLTTALHGYISLAAELLTPSDPVLVAIGGRSGTGKSTLATALAPALEPLPGALVLRSDTIRKRQHGYEPTRPLPATAYSQAASGQVYAEILDRCRLLLATGRSVIADAVYADPETRTSIAAVARDAGIAFCGLWLTAPEKTLLARVNARGADASDADADVVQAQRRLDAETVDWSVIESRDPSAVVDEAWLGIASACSQHPVRTEPISPDDKEIP